MTQDKTDRQDYYNNHYNNNNNCITDNDGADYNNRWL